MTINNSKLQIALATACMNPYDLCKAVNRKLFKSLFPYGREKIKPDFDKNLALAMAFDILSMAIDRDKERYARRCEANRENGRKGGRPKKNQTDIEVTEKSERLFSKPKKADKDRDKDMDKDMEKGMDM